MAYAYYRVRSDAKTWTDNGPDLLRPHRNAQRAVMALVGDAGMGGQLFTRRSAADGLTEWAAAPNRATAMDRWRAWTRGASDGDTFQIGAKATPRSRMRLLAVTRYDKVAKVDIAHCSPATVRIHSLVRHQFPKSIPSGGFLYRPVEGARQPDGSAYWSDHAWGTALDESMNAKEGVSNDEITSWVSRMGREGCIEYDYALGSIDGKVKSMSAPGYELKPSSAAISHTWHVHISVQDHDGRKPPRNPMYK